VTGRLSWAPLAYPPLLAAAFVLSIYLDTPVSLPQTFRALLTLVLTSSVLQMGASLLLHSRAAGAIVAACGVLILMFGWVITLAALSWAWLWIRLGRAGTPPVWLPAPATVNRAMGTLTVAFATVVVVTGIFGGALGLPRLPPAPTVPAAASGDPPDLFVILLDAYARADTLARLGFDNRPFLDELNQRGFQVAEHSRSNYSRTGLTLASMFNMAYLHDIPALASPPAGYNQQHRLLGDTLHAGNPALDTLEAAGYETFSIPSRAAQYAIEPVDQVLAGSELDNFEIHLVCKTALGVVSPPLAIGTIYDQQRARIREAFATAASLAVAPHERGRFVFTHVMAPHPPFIFDAKGRPAAVPELPSVCGALEPSGDPALAQARYLDQLTFLNILVLEAVDRILAAEPDALIVLMSDHGSRLDSTDFAESTANFMALRAARVAVPSTMTPVALFPMLLNGYLGTRLQVPEPRSFASVERAPWPVREVP
jgi:hypothetical protein